MADTKISDLPAATLPTVTAFNLAAGGRDRQIEGSAA